jgi:hypothetical protein
MNVQCCNRTDGGNNCNDTPWISQNEKLVCHGSRCITTIDPLPPQWVGSQYWTPCGGGAFWYRLAYNVDPADTIFVDGAQYSGAGDSGYQWVGSGTAPVTVLTSSINHYSHGIRSLTAWCSGW